MPDEMRFTALGSKHASEKERTACLHRFDINPEGPRWRWKRDAKFRQALLSARLPEEFDWALCL
jgi:hypothetical protein